MAATTVRTATTVAGLLETVARTLLSHAEGLRAVAGVDASPEMRTKREGAVNGTYLALTDHALPMLADVESWLLSAKARLAEAAPAPVATPAPVAQVAAPAVNSAPAVAASAPAPAVKAAKAKTAKPKAKAPKAAALAEYRELVAKCKAAGLPAKGTKAELTARLAKHTAPKAAPAAAQVKTPPAAKVTTAPASLPNGTHKALAKKLGVDVADLVDALAALGLTLNTATAAKVAA